MSTDAMSVPTLFDFVPTDPAASTLPACDASAIDPPAHPPPPNNDDAPELGSNGAGVSNPRTSPDLTRLPLMPPARHNAPAGTSKVAAQRIAGHAAKQRADVLAVIVKAGALGATDAEIEAATGLRAQSVSPRRGELVKLGLVIDSGERRPTPRGRPAAVWVAASLARKSKGFSSLIPSGSGGTA